MLPNKNSAEPSWFMRRRSRARCCSTPSDRIVARQGPCPRRLLETTRSTGTQNQSGLCSRKSGPMLRCSVRRNNCRSARVLPLPPTGNHQNTGSPQPAVSRTLSSPPPSLGGRDSPALGPAARAAEPSKICGVPTKKNPTGEVNGRASESVSDRRKHRELRIEFYRYPW